MRLLLKLLNIDRRVMYALLFAIIIILLRWPTNWPMEPTSAVRGVYNAVEEIPQDKIVILSIFYSSSTLAENGPQTEAFIRHLFRRGVPFAILAWDQQGAQLSLDIAQRVSKELGKTYGVDWCSWGFRPPYLDQIIPALAKNIPGTIKKDTFGTDVSKLPMMSGVKTIDEDVGLIADITPVASLESWIGLVHGVYGTPVAYAPTLVMAPEAFNFLDAHQIVGILPGMVGAGQYEALLEYRGLGQIGSGALSGSHLLIVVLIILGNIGYFASRRLGSEGGTAAR